ncbi:FAM135A protein [Spatholobus suberectus]|nr:FAM135A protein [Spatholobus suberectus]
MKDLATTAVILKFELIYAPTIENGADLEASLDASSAAIHEFQIPPKALIGLHSYCPVHFDALHAVLVDVSVHVSLLEAASYSSASKLPSNSADTEVIIDRSYNTLNQGLGGVASLDMKNVMLVKGLLTARDILLEELQKISKAVNEALDISEFVSIMSNMKLLNSVLQANQFAIDVEVVGEGKPQNGLKPLQTAATRVELHRKSIEQMRINNSSIQDMQIFGDPLHMPIVIVEHVINVARRCPSANSLLRHIGHIDSDSLPIGLSSDFIGKKFAPQSNARVLEIVVFVHGFQACLGHHLDLRLVRNQWLLIDPKVEFLMSEANKDKTFGDFREMGHRLAKEVISFLKSKMDKASRFGNLGDIRLSFVGHSIGNLIIRTAIADSMMEPFLRHLHTYVSVSGPHLGYLYSSNSLFNSRLWFLKKLKGTQCIHQLTFTDDPDFQNTFLYKLCKQKTLEHFRNIILLSSPQDGYVPYHSARIESCQAASRDTSKKGKLFLEMLNDCLDQIRANSTERRVFMRCDVNFDASTQCKNLDSIIGRAAHIEFLDSDIFARFIMWSFPDLFR